jgi:hypothetical protein
MAATWRNSLRLAHNARIPVASLEKVEKRKPGPKPAKESAAQSTDRKSETDGAAAKSKRGASNRSGGDKGAEEDGEEGRREMTVAPANGRI